MQQAGRLLTRAVGGVGWGGHAALLPRKAWLPGSELEMATQGHPS